MKRKIGISCFGIRLGLFLLLAFSSQLLFAQEDSTRLTRDSVRIKPVSGMYSPFKVSPEKLITFPVLQPEYPSSLPVVKLPDFKLKEQPLNLDLPYQTNPSLLFRGDFRTSGVMKEFRDGTLSGSGGQTSVPGIGRFNEAALLYEHVLSQNLKFQLGMDAMKINMSYITGQTFSASGALIYQASDRLAFKVFGSYAIGKTYGMNTHTYGGSMSLDMSDRFGMEVGVQRYYDSMRGRWETVPMVIPYYKFDKFKLGLDVGGILYEILRSTVFESKGSMGSPTIAAPRFQIPIR